MPQPVDLGSTSLPIGSWVFSLPHGESVRILDVETVWSHTYYQFWIPRLATVERVPAESLSPGQPTKATSTSRRNTRAKERDDRYSRPAEFQANDEKSRRYSKIKISLDLDECMKLKDARFGALRAEATAVTASNDDES